MVIAGPTGIGKTALAIKLADYFGCEIISADSRQFYRELSVGTAKPTAGELQMVKHHFINSLGIKESYSAGKFEKEVIALLESKFKENRIMIMCGGSGLFIDAVCNGFDETGFMDEKIRNELVETLETNGIEFLQQELEKKDPVYFKEVDLNNPQRLLRALEVIALSGKPFSELRQKTKKERAFTVIKILINAPREEIYKRINLRVDKMMESGLEEEARQLLPHKNLNALNTVGYKELFRYFENQISREEAINQIKTNTRRYAKRQLTWFKNDSEYTEFGPDDFDKIKAFVEVIMQHG